jgi:hypothetical protein
MKSFSGRFQSERTPAGRSARVVVLQIIGMFMINTA